MGILTYNGKQFYLDGEPFTVISGAMHYFRIPRDYWRDRLQKLKECGFNTVETYTCWNLHERREGEFDFSENLDLETYIDTAAELGLHVILRPGPYICAEWDLGGLPSWLLNYDGMDLRCDDELFLSKVRRYYDELLPRIRPRLAANGGNIFMLQIENEYGSYGNDHTYMRKIADIYLEHGMNCLLFTSDGPTLTMLNGGSLDEYLSVANFGSRPREQFAEFEKFRDDQPLMCGEYWCGWFDHWGEEHHVRPAEEIVSDVREFIEMGASFNFYMFHGGTNFGFTNGANHIKSFEPTVTSYDYNAPLSEAGDRTETYYRIRELIGEKFGDLPPLTAKDSKKAAYGCIKMSEKAKFFDNFERISRCVSAPSPKYMENLGQDFGYILYSTTLHGPSDGWGLSIDEVHDRAQVFVNGAHVGTFERWAKENYPKIGIPLKKSESAQLDILCENMGRINYGPRIRDRKGIRGVRFGNQYHFGWDMYSLPMDDLSALEFKETDDEICPAFYRGKLNIEGEPCDTFLYPKGFSKGFIMINGINIGRYFMSAGPQKTLYVPAPFLREGENEIIIFDSDGATTAEIEFKDKPEL